MFAMSPFGAALRHRCGRLNWNVLLSTQFIDIHVSYAADFDHSGQCGHDGRTFVTLVASARSWETTW